MSAVADSFLKDAPNLWSFLSELIERPVNYCLVCLRTEQERRLVKPDAYLKFISATKIVKLRTLRFDYNNKALICYICEQKASNALKMYEAAAFANSMRLVLGSLLRDTSHNMTKAGVERIMKSFKHIDLEHDLIQARKLSNCLETQVLLIDTNLPPNTEVNISNVDEMYITPDDITTECDDHNQSDIDEEPYHTAIASTERGSQRDTEMVTKDSNDIPKRSSSENLIVIEVDDDEDPGPPRVFQPRPEILQLANSIVNNDPATARGQHSLGTFILQPVMVPNFIQNNDTSIPNNSNFSTKNLKSHKNISIDNSLSKNSILRPIRIASKPKSSIDANISSIVARKSSIGLGESSFVARKSSIGLGESSFVASKSSIDLGESSFVACKSSIDLGESSFVARKSSNVANESPLQVFSCASVPGLSNCHLIVDKGTIFYNINQNNKVQKIKSPTIKSKPENPSKIIPRSLETQFGDHLDCVKNNASGATPNKVAKLPEKKNQKAKDVDWEDKIPMDVISYVDAVDPNPPSWEGTNIAYIENIKDDEEIIDLC